MIDYFNINQEISLPALANQLNISSDRFIVKQRFDGGMGTCYCLKDFQGKCYALKVIHSELLNNEKSIHRYKEELRLWLTFSACDSVAEALCIVMINDIPCIVSKWMDNGDMTSLIQSANIEYFYKTMDRIITGLKWVNDKYHVIHRDLKPGNILVDEHYNTFIADWGLAKIISNDTNNSTSLPNNEIPGINPYLTQKGAFVGTALYASPEQLLGFSKIDHRSDIYSLGCIMYEWETGKPPFIAKTLKEIVAGHLYEEPKKLGGFFKSTNFKAESIIMKCLEKNPDDRYQSYNDLLTDLHSKANKYISGFVPYSVKERYQSVNIGHNELDKHLNNGDLGYIGKKDYGVIELQDIIPYLKEAMALSSLGEHKKAIDIYQRFFVKDSIIQMPDYEPNQVIAVNLAYELNAVSQPQKALDTILTISKAKQKPDTYYVNLSNIYISLLDFKNCAITCEEGLSIFPNDPDIIGNYTISLKQLGRLKEAIKSAENRLKLGRDTHSICELAGVIFDYAENLKNIDFPEAIDLYKSVLSLYREALLLNPQYRVALYNVTTVLFKMKRYDDSMDNVAAVSKIEKGTTELNAFYAARNLFWSQNYSDALTFCSDWLKKIPNSISLKRIMSQVITDGYCIGKYNKNGLPIIERSSLEFFNEIVDNKSQRIPSDIIYLAKLHFWMNGPEEINYAMNLLEQGGSIYPNNWKFNYYLARHLLRYKQPQKALKQALKAKDKAPWREKVYLVLSDAYAANEQPELASKMLSEYKRIKDLKNKLYDSCKSL